MKILMIMARGQWYVRMYLFCVRPVSVCDCLNHKFDKIGETIVLKISASVGDDRF